MRGHGCFRPTGGLFHPLFPRLSVFFLHHVLSVGQLVVVRLLSKQVAVVQFFGEVGSVLVDAAVLQHPGLCVFHVSPLYPSFIWD